MYVGGADARASTPPPPAVPATVTPGAGTIAVPNSFFGLSVAYNQLASYEREGPVFDRLLSMIHPQPGMVLRLGGRSADRAYWQTSTSGAPRGVFELSDPWITQLGALVRRDHLHVMLDLNLAVHSPSSAASFAKAVIDRLPRSTVTGLMIGNEPDLYNHESFLTRERIPSTLRSTPRDWTRNYSPPDYRRDFSAYTRVLHRALPGLPVGGPEIASASPKWVQSLEGLGPLGPAFLTLHRYASSYCFPATSSRYPSIPLMLSPSSSTGLASTARAAIAIARTNKQPLLVDEANSISCNGGKGVADSFATALWAPDLLFAMVHQGVNGINWHIRPNMPNAPFEITEHGVEPQPELYGLVLFSQMTPPGAQLVNTKLSAPPGLALKSWVVRVGGGLRTLLINKGRTPINVTLAAGTSGPATITRLKAPTIGSLSGIRYANRWIGSDGRWHGRFVAQTEQAQSGVYRVALGPYSAALVTSR
ncbi:MAG TPA: hypothetical protein VN880_04695 [Solirubrobacteraceae bacterium]|nr:hypothetical protein [Solirubrobacteraceae bacterium]